MSVRKSQIDKVITDDLVLAYLKIYYRSIEKWCNINIRIGM